MIFIIVLIGIVLLLGLSFGGAWLGFPEAQNMADGFTSMATNPVIGFSSLLVIVVAILSLLLVGWVFMWLGQIPQRKELQRQAREHYGVELPDAMTLEEMENFLK